MSYQTVLFISYDGLTDNLGQSQILPYMNGLAQHGHRVHILTVDKPNLYQERAEQVQSLINENVQWRSIAYHKSPAILSTLWDLKALERKADWIINEYNVSLLHVRSYPPMDLAIRLKHKYGLKLIFDMRGFYADERIEGSIWSLSNPIHSQAYKRIKKKERVYFSDADHIISLTEAGSAYIHEQFNSSKSKLTVIPCCADFDHFKLIEGADTKDDSLQIVYLGSLGTWYLIPQMLKLFQRITKLYPKAKLHILTGDSPIIIASELPALGLSAEQVEVKHVKRSELPEILGAMDLSLFFIKESFSKKASSPTKLAELLAAGVPIICNSGVGDLAKIASSHIGVAAYPLEEIENIDLDSLLSQLLAIEASEIRAQAKKEFSLQIALERYLAVYQILTSSI